VRRPWIVAALVAVCAIPTLAYARPGGGESFSGGGGHGGGGHGGGGGGGGGSGLGELIYWVLRLIFYYPQVGVPLLLVVVGFFAWSAYQQHHNRDWDSGPAATLEAAIELDELRSTDPDFSQVLFEDFAFRLFSTCHRARPAKLATVAPYVSPAARDALAAREPENTTVTQVVVGALRVVRFEPGERTRIAVEFEANLATAQHTYYSVETWLFARDATRHSKPPGGGRDFPCPNCGAPWQASASGSQVCASCGQVVDNGRFDWVVENIALASQDERAPTLTAEVEERGTDLPTYLQPHVDDRYAELAADDPACTEAALLARLRMIYDQLNRSWAENRLGPTRAFVSAGLYDYLQYWIDAYAQQGLRNALVDMRITGTELAKVERDRWYDAVTIRLWGTGLDYVVDTNTGALVRGSKHRERAYSEYWTLVRSATRKGAPRGDSSCSNCGAPLTVTMSGECEHCGAHVTAGEFDWVVSKIEQDDTYRG
jgi:hypothetical protein